MRPTRWPILVAVVVAAGTAMYLITRSSYDTMPRPGTLTLVSLGLLVIAAFYTAVMTRARLAGRAGTKPIDPLLVARLVAMAKAASVVGAFFAGGYAGFLIWVSRLDSTAASHDTKVASFGVGLGLLLMGGGLFLENVCRVPKRDDDDDERHADGLGR